MMLGIGPLVIWSLLVAAEGGQQWIYGLLVSAALVLKYNGDILRNILIGTAYKPCNVISISLSAMLLIMHITLKGVVPAYAETVLLSILALWAVGMCAIQLIHTTLFCCRELKIRVFLLSPEQQRAISGQRHLK